MNVALITISAIFCSGLSGCVAVRDIPHSGVIGCAAGIVLGLMLTPFVLWAFSDASYYQAVVWYYIPQLVCASAMVLIDDASIRLIGGGLQSVALALVAGAILRRTRRPRDLTLCSKCGYCLFGCPSARCPECGDRRAASCADRNAPPGTAHPSAPRPDPADR